MDEDAIRFYGITPLTSINRHIGEVNPKVGKRHEQSKKDDPDTRRIWQHDWSQIFHGSYAAQPCNEVTFSNLQLLVQCPMRTDFNYEVKNEGFKRLKLSK